MAPVEELLQGCRIHPRHCRRLHQLRMSHAHRQEKIRRRLAVYVLERKRMEEYARLYRESGVFDEATIEDSDRSDAEYENL